MSQSIFSVLSWLLQSKDKRIQHRIRIVEQLRKLYTMKYQRLLGQVPAVQWSRSPNTRSPFAEIFDALRREELLPGLSRKEYQVLAKVNRYNTDEELYQGAQEMMRADCNILEDALRYFERNKLNRMSSE